MKWINNYFKDNHNLEDFNLNNSTYLENIKNYYQKTSYLIIKIKKIEEE